MNRCVFNRSSLEQSANELVTLQAQITIKGSATLANINGYSDRPDGVIVYVETVSNTAPTVTEDSGANLGTLESETAPCLIGVLVMDGKFAKFLDCTVVNISSASMTAATISKKGASSSGVTASGNLAFVISGTNLDIDAGGSVDHTFDIIVRALRKTGN